MCLSVSLQARKCSSQRTWRTSEVQEGSSATFCCRISPADYKPVHWFLDKTPLSANELNEIEAQPGGYHVLTCVKAPRTQAPSILRQVTSEPQLPCRSQVGGRPSAQCMVGTSPYG